VIDRRRFLAAAALLGAVVVPASHAQPARRARIGFLANGSVATSAPAVDALRRGLRDLGWIEDQTITIEFQWADGRTDRLQELVAELVRAKVDVIVVSGAPAIIAAQRATRSIPIVFVVLVDPVALGLVRSLARPGGNATGLASQYEELVTKQLQLLTEAVPNLSRVALLRHTTSLPSILTSAQSAARALGLDVRTLEVTREAEFDGAFKMAKSAGAGEVCTAF